MKASIPGVAGVALVWLFSLPSMMPCRAQLPEMTFDQARRILMSYVQCPDVGLFNPTADSPMASRVDADGHKWYIFHGAPNRSGGEYEIDAVTGEKRIDYVQQSKSNADSGGTPPLLPRTRLATIAAAYAKQHFSLFSRCIDNTWYDGSDTTYVANYVVVAASGVTLPIRCSVDVEADTGAVVSYTELNLPVTIGTSPGITQAQAIAAGQHWILRNMSINPASSRLFPLYDPPVGLTILVDPMLNETLVYEVGCTACVLFIDAQTGAVLGLSGWDLAELPAATWSPTHRAETEVFWEVRYYSDVVYAHSAIATHGQVYLWRGFLKTLNVEAIEDGKSVLIRHGAKSVELAVEKQAAGTATEAWSRNGILYLPVTALEGVGCHLSVDSAQRHVDLIPLAPGDK